MLCPTTELVTYGLYCMAFCVAKDMLRTPFPVAVRRPARRGPGQPLAKEKVCMRDAHYSYRR